MPRKGPSSPSACLDLPVLQALCPEFFIILVPTSQRTRTGPPGRVGSKWTGIGTHGFRSCLHFEISGAGKQGGSRGKVRRSRCGFLRSFKELVAPWSEKPKSGLSAMWLGALRAFLAGATSPFMVSLFPRETGPAEPQSRTPTSTLGHGGPGLPQSYPTGISAF